MWPPSINKYIIVKKPIQYIGKVIKILKNNVGIIIKLVNGYENPHDDAKQYIKASDNWKKYMLVIETDKYKYIDGSKIKDYEPEKYMEGELIYDVAGPEKSSTLTSHHYASATAEPNINIPMRKLINAQDLDEFAFITRPSINPTNEHQIDNTTIIENPEDVDSLISGYIKTSRDKIIKYLEGSGGSEKKADADAIITGQDLESHIERMNNNPTKPYDILVVDTDLIEKYVDNIEGLQFNAEKIIKFLSLAFYLEGPKKATSDEQFYNSLRFIYYNGYVHIFRTDIPILERITHNLLEDDADNPKLKILGPAEYNIPIRHNVLKFILFQSELQKEMLVDQELLREAEIILSQEYIIALTPEPRYQMWCIVRLIKLWYGDIDLQNNIRKIKLIVNQYRTRSDKKYNIHNGIRFSIGIYPRYGKKSASIVFKKLMYYFALYFQAVGWKNNPPSYFKIVNDLISYTNCDQSLKLYYRRVGEQYGLENDEFTKNYSLIKRPGFNTDILEQYIK
jgi:hypothetical protein